MGNSDNPHKQHRQRVKDSYKKTGLDGMHYHEIIELLLFYSIPRRDVNEIAHRLADRYKSLNELMNADYNQLICIKGVGDNTAILIKLINDLFAYSDRQKWIDKRPIFISNSDVGRYLCDLFGKEKEEQFWLISLNAEKRLLSSTKVSVGSISEAPVIPARVIKSALDNSAELAIIAHNHTNSSVSPSEEDFEVTSKLHSLFQALSIPLIDHVVISGDTFHSMANAGQMPNQIYRRN